MTDPVEADRLATLARMGVMGAPREPLFDSLTELAARTFDVPVALISLIDKDRQRFKACIGLDADETSCDIAFCDYAILSDEVMVVADATQDLRFANNPLVTGAPGIRFYAGAPLITDEGHRLGTLCVIDFKPRQTFAAADREKLKGLSLSVIQALTLRMQARETARVASVAAERARLLSLAEQMAKIGTWSWEIASDRTTWSAEVYTIHGFDPLGPSPDLEGALAPYHPEDAKTLAGLVERAVKEGTGYELHARLFRPDGTERQVIARGDCRTGDDGAVTGLFGTFQDVTDLKLADAALRRSEARYRMITDRVTDIIIHYDLDGVIEFASPSVTRYGYDPADLVGRTLAELTHPEDLEANRRRRADILRGVIPPSAEGSELRLMDGAGAWVWCEGSPAPVYDDTGRAVGAVTVLRDITARRTMEDELRRRQAEAEAATAAKSEFLANMSHEIRTPLTGIVGFAGLLAEVPNLPERAVLCANRITTASQTLLCVVNDILDFSKIEAGQVELDPQPFDPEAFVRDTVELVMAQAQNKALSVRIEPRGSLPATVLADASRMRQVLLNLLTNAIKFTASGGVTVGLSYLPANGGSLRIAVSDTGVGIPHERADRLFQRFSQVDGSISREYGGTGLGLAICKSLAELMGGAIGVESEDGAGSTFWFTIEAPIVDASATTSGEQGFCALGAPANILVVDDSAVNRELVSALLGACDHRITEAASGGEAVEAALREPFDLILMDLQMPGMDGLAATRAIRAMSDMNATTPIVALTANVLPAHLEACRLAGMDDHVGKPIEPGVLIGKVSYWARGASADGDFRIRHA